MSKITVCGLVNVEVTVPVKSFPVEYNPVNYEFFGITMHPSGVGLNLVSALNTLGDDTRLLTYCADDSAGGLIKSYLQKNGIGTEYICSASKATAQSVILYDEKGKRSIYCDLTDNQEQSFDEEIFRKSSQDSDVVVLCNINYTRNLIPLAKEMGLTIATDVHCLWNVNDEYNRDYIKGADILFLSNENFIGREEEFLKELKEVSSAKIIVVGMGSKGALLYTRDNNSFKVFPAVYTREVVNTIGAGDSLFSSFIHFYAKTKDAEKSLALATVFASYKIGDTSACRGFLSEKELLDLAESKGI